MKIYVGNLPFSTTENDLQTLFEEHGPVDSVSIITDRDTGRSRGFGFVEMSDDDAQNAIDALDNHQMDGRPLRVNKARPRRGGGGGGGGGRGRGRDRW
jgi:RNA recognition motif-containing protein